MKQKQEPQAVTFQEFVKIILSMNKKEQKELAEKLGKAQSTVSKIITGGNPNLSTVSELLCALGEDVVFTLKDGQTFKIIF